MKNDGSAWFRRIGLGFDVCIASLEKHKTKYDRPITSEEVNLGLQTTYLSLHTRRGILPGKQEMYISLPRGGAVV